MADYTYAQTVNADALNDTLGESAISTLVDGIVATDASVTIQTNVALDAGQQGTLDGILAAHNPALPSVAQRIRAAKTFAAALIDKWQKRILLDGVVQAGQAYAVATALAESTIHANYGNLYALEEELGTVAPIATFLDAARLTEIRNEIRTYLGLPLL